jgi:hypothetical protein
VIKLRRITSPGHEAHVDDTRNAYIILVRKCDGITPLRRPGHRQEDNIRMDLREVGWIVVDCIHSLRIGATGGLL